MDYEGTRYGGYYMEYPTPQEAAHYSRELDYDERISLLTQGFHFGSSCVHCYSFREFVAAVGKREFNNPAGGVRSLEKEKILPWLLKVIGDRELANAISKIYQSTDRMQEIMDTLSTVVYVRKAQYDEVIASLEEGAEPEC